MNDQLINWLTREINTEVNQDRKSAYHSVLNYLNSTASEIKEDPSSRHMDIAYDLIKYGGSGYMIPPIPGFTDTWSRITVEKNLRGF